MTTTIKSLSFQIIEITRMILNIMNLIFSAIFAINILQLFDVDFPADHAGQVYTVRGI